MTFWLIAGTVLGLIGATLTATGLFLGGEGRKAGAYSSVLSVLSVSYVFSALACVVFVILFVVTTIDMFFLN